MKFANVIRAVYHEPWLITPAGWEMIDALISARLARGDDFKAEGLADLLPAAAQMTISDGVATIPVHGPIGKKLGGIEKACGACDLNDLSAMIDAAMADPSVSSLTFDFDSPGGTVRGVAEMADKIHGLSKPTLAYSETMCASAAYYLAASCDRVVGTPSSTWGSVGVMLPVVDKSKAFAAQGVSVDVIKGGDLKGAGVPGTSLTKEQRADLQSMVDEMHGDFKASVVRKRTNVSEDSMRGQSFTGRKAAALGLITGLVSEFPRGK